MSRLPVAQQTPEQRRQTKMYRVDRARGVKHLVPVGPAQNHVRELHYAYGMTFTRMSELSGKTPGRIAEIMYGRNSDSRDAGAPVLQIQKGTEEALLALRPETSSRRGGAVDLNPAGTIRRIQGLVALGYPLLWQANTCGVHVRGLGDLARGRRERVFYTTARAVRSMYEKYESDLNPLAHGVTMRDYKVCLGKAREYGYARPILWDWDTLDDPEAFADWTGYCGTPTGYYHHEKKGILPACAPCKRAKASTQAEWRSRG